MVRIELEVRDQILQSSPQWRGAEKLEAAGGEQCQQALRRFEDRDRMQGRMWFRTRAIDLGVGIVHGEAMPAAVEGDAFMPRAKRACDRSR